MLYQSTMKASLPFRQRQQRTSTNRKSTNCVVHATHDNTASHCFLLLLLLLILANGSSDGASTSASSALSTSSAMSTSSAPWWPTETTAENDDVSQYYLIPPSSFAPGGRLYSVEAALRAARGQYPGSSPRTGTVVVALPYREGMVIVSSVPQSPYIFDNDDNDDDDDRISLEKKKGNDRNDSLIPTSSNYTFNNNTSLLLWDTTTTTQTTTTLHFHHPHHSAFVQFNPRVWGITADGSVVDGQVWRHQTTAVAAQQQSSSLRLTASQLAQRMANMAQQPTQAVLQSGRRLLASTLLLWETKSTSTTSSTGTTSTTTTPLGEANEPSTSTVVHLWRVDPNGQFWKCHAAVVGWGVTSLQVEQDLLKRCIQEASKGRSSNSGSTSSSPPQASSLLKNKNNNPNGSKNTSDNDSTDNNNKEKEEGQQQRQELIGTKRLSRQEWEELRMQLDRDQALAIAVETIQAVLSARSQQQQHADDNKYSTDHKPKFFLQGMVVNSQTGKVEFV